MGVFDFIGDIFGGGGGNQPAPPDYGALADQSNRSNQQAAYQQTYANRGNQYSPFGSTTYKPTVTTDPTTGQKFTTWNQNTTLNPTMQGTLNWQQKLAGQQAQGASNAQGYANQIMAKPMDWNKAQAWGQRPDVNQMNPMDLQGAIDTKGMQNVDAFGKQRQSAEGAIYQRSTSRLDPQWQQRDQQLQSDLRARGLREGDAAYDTAMQNQGRERTDAYQTAQNESIMGGGEEATRNFQSDMALREQQFMQSAQQRGMTNEEAQGEWSAQRQQLDNMYGQQMQQANYMNQLRAAQQAEGQAQRLQPLNEAQAMQGQPVQMPNMPNFGAAGGSTGTNYMDAGYNQYQADSESAARQNQANQNGINSLFNLGSNVFGSGGFNFF